MRTRLFVEALNLRIFEELTLFVEASNLSSYLEVRIGGEVALQALVALVLDRRLGLQALKISNAVAIFEFSSKSAFSTLYAAVVLLYFKQG